MQEFLVRMISYVPYGTFVREYHLNMWDNGTSTYRTYVSVLENRMQEQKYNKKNLPLTSELFLSHMHFYLHVTYCFLIGNFRLKDNVWMEYTH